MTEHDPSDPDRGSSREERDPPERKWMMNRRWLIVMAASLVLGVALAIGGAVYLNPDCEDRGCPSVERLASYRPPEPPQIHGADGEIAGQLSGPRRIVIGLEDIPDLVREGYVAVEDRDFYDHGGFDVEGLFRALWVNLRSRGVQEGGSTITMQLARNVFGEEVLEYSRWHRKLTEIRLARQIESQLDKDDILELYLNQIYLGDGVYGVETAARHYFGKPVAEVSASEAALLVGLAKNPEGYNPRRNPENARARRDVVLDILVREGVVERERAEAAKAEEFDLVESSLHTDWGVNAYYLSGVRRELRQILPLPEDRVGVHVYTGLDTRLQAIAHESLREQIRRIERGVYGYYPHDIAPDSLGIASGVSPYLQGMLVAMDPQSGLVRALMGGRDYQHSEYDRAFQARRQPGSAFKPIVYSAAIEQGMRLSQEISTEPVRFARRGMEDWQPQDDQAGRGEMTVRDALVHSSNSAAVRVGTRVGTERVARQAMDLGITTDIPRYPSIYLGAAEVIPAELVAAYAAFGNGGRTVTPHLITRIESHDGRVVWQREPTAARALDPKVAFLMLDVMRDVVNRGTGWRVREAGYAGPAAGKTGTTNESRDLWFVGMTPALVAGVWVGFDRPQTVVEGAGGGTLAAPAWGRFVRDAHRGQRLADWEAPPGIVQVRLDARTGFPLREDCPYPGPVTTEYYIAGTDPYGYCPADSDLYYSPYGDAWAWDTLGERGFEWDTLRRSEGDRTIFYRGDSLEEAEERRQERARRERVLDSIRRARPDRPDTFRPGVPRPAVPDTTRPTPRPADTTRPPPDTTRPPPDTTGRPLPDPPAAPEDPPADTTRIDPPGGRPTVDGNRPG